LKENITSESCFLCLRITPEKVLSKAHKIWANGNLARNIALESSALIRKAYAKKPTFFCGKKPSGVLCSLFYLLGIKHDAIISQEELAMFFGISKATVKANVRRWLDILSEYLTGFSFETRYVYSTCVQHVLCYKGKTITSLMMNPKKMAVLNYEWVDCPECKGEGHSTSIWSWCPTCNGMGVIFESPLKCMK